MDTRTILLLNGAYGVGKTTVVAEPHHPRGRDPGARRPSVDRADDVGSRFARRTARRPDEATVSRRPGVLGRPVSTMYARLAERGIVAGSDEGRSVRSHAGRRARNTQRATSIAASTLMAGRPTKLPMTPSRRSQRRASRRNDERLRRLRRLPGGQVDRRRRRDLSRMRASHAVRSLNAVDRDRRERLREDDDLHAPHGRR